MPNPLELAWELSTPQFEYTDKYDGEGCGVCARGFAKYVPRVLSRHLNESRWRGMQASNL